MKFKIYMLASVTSMSLKSENQLRHEITWKNSRKGITFYFKTIDFQEHFISRRPLHGILLQN